MANTRQVLSDRFIAVNGAGKRQSAWDTPMANSDLDTRDKCTITREEVVTRRDYRDCEDVDIVDSKVDSRFARWTLTYTEINAQILARWSFLHLGASTAPTGAPADEVQTLERTGTVSGGTFAVTVTLEGRTAKTKPIAWNASTAAIQAALTASGMKFIEPGDVTVGGDWTGGITLTFTGRLAKANIPVVVIDATLLTGSTPGISVTETAAGAQNAHVGSRSTTRVKPLISFALGWVNVANRVEKFINAVVESATPTLSLDGDVGLTVTLLSPWEYDSIEESFSIPSCTQINALQSKDCRVSINSVWQTTDINTLTVPVNDAVPTDRLSAFGFDGIDVERFERGRQPVYGPISASIFGSETDSLYTLAQNERTQSAVPVIIHFGMPGDRCTWNFPDTEIRFQTNRLGEAGDARYSTIQIDGQPFKDGTNPPFNIAASLAQSTQFLLT